MTECPECLAALDWPLIGAAASVGIEHGKSTQEMVHIYLAGFHERGHQAFEPTGHVHLWVSVWHDDDPLWPEAPVPVTHFRGQTSALICCIACEEIAYVIRSEVPV